MKMYEMKYVDALKKLCDIMDKRTDIDAVTFDREKDKMQIFTNDTVHELYCDEIRKLLPKEKEEIKIKDSSKYKSIINEAYCAKISGNMTDEQELILDLAMTIHNARKKLDDSNLYHLLYDNDFSSGTN